MPAEAVRRVGQLEEVEVERRGHRLSPRRPARPILRSTGREVLSGLKEGERVVLPRAGRIDSGEADHDGARSGGPGGPPGRPGPEPRFPERNRPRLPRQQLLDHPDRRLGADRPGGPAGHAPRGRSADRRAAGRRDGQHAGLLRRAGRAARRPRRWRRSSTRSTASSTSTACRARTRPSSPSGSTSAKTASEALSSCSRRSTRHLDIVPPGVTGWVVKPVEIDDVPIVTLTLTGDEDDSYALRRVGEEVVQRLSALPGVSRACGHRRRATDDPRRPRSRAAPGVRARARSRSSSASRGPTSLIRPATSPATTRWSRSKAGIATDRPEQLAGLVVGVFRDRPVFLKDVATVRDGPAEVSSYVRHGWGPARGFEAPHGFPGTLVGRAIRPAADRRKASRHRNRAVTLAISKQKGTNAVAVAESVLGGGRGSAPRRHPGRYGAGRHPQLGPDRRREGQRAGRGPLGRHR